jgi:bile acid:Na+ symporter, BASS family
MVLILLKLSIALTVFAIGLQSTMSDATYLFRHPRDLVRAFVSMYVVMPLAAIALVMTFNLHPAVKIALVALSVSPVPPIFPKKAAKAGGEGDYSVGLLVATGILAVAVIPITIEIFGAIGGIPLQVPLRSIALLVFTSILAPLLLGIAVAAIVPAFATKIAKPIGIGATVVLVLCLLPVLLKSLGTIFSLIGDGTLLSFIAFALIGYFAGDFLGRPEFEKRSVLALATATRHPAIALAMASASFPEQKLALPAILLYFIVSAIVTGLASRRKPAKGIPTETQRPMAA